MPTAPLAALHSAFAEPVTYRVGGAGAGTAISAVRIDEAGPGFQGPGAVVRRTIFEVRMADIAARPKRADTITDSAATLWRVIDVEDHDAVSAWQATVELVEDVEAP